MQSKITDADLHSANMITWPLFVEVWLVICSGSCTKQNTNMADSYRITENLHHYYTFLESPSIEGHLVYTKASHLLSYSLSCYLHN